MSPEQRIALLQARTARALIEMEGMKAENAIRADRGKAPAYDEQAFSGVIGRNGLDESAVLALLSEEPDPYCHCGAIRAEQSCDHSRPVGLTCPYSSPR